MVIDDSVEFDGFETGKMGWLGVEHDPLCIVIRL